MKRLATLACISMFAAIISCQRSDDNLPAPRSTKATTARELFDRQSHALPNTDGLTENIVRPMPIGMTPQWNMAIEAPYSDGVAVAVPISSTIGYLATYPCTDHDHEAGHAHHTEQSIPVTQKLIILMPSAGVDSLCYVVNIIPYADCSVSSSALAEGFTYGSSFAGFSGFAAYHRFDGSLSHIDGYDNGTVANTALPGDNDVISMVTRNAQLFIENQMKTKAFDPRYDICAICFHRCGAAVPYDITAISSDVTHCPVCRKYKGNGPAHPSQCTCRPPAGSPCRTCGIINCSTDHYPTPGFDCFYCGTRCASIVDPRQNPTSLQRTLLYNAFSSGYIPATVLHLMQEGSYALERNRQGSGDEFYHNLLAPNVSATDAVARVRNYFVSTIRGYKNSKGGYIPILGEAIHPLLDYFVPIQDRVNALQYHSYLSYTNIIQTMPGSTSYAIQRLYNAIQALPQYPTDAQIIAVFDEWCSGNGT